LKYQFLSFSPWRRLVDERIKNAKIGESSEVAVDFPELVDSVFDRERYYVGIMDKVAGGMTGPYSPAEMRGVCGPLTQKDIGYLYWIKVPAYIKTCW
jgi:hypothetical protein